jgi:hypothetical protein
MLLVACTTAPRGSDDLGALAEVRLEGWEAFEGGALEDAKAQLGAKADAEPDPKAKAGWLFGEAEAAHSQYLAAVVSQSFLDVPSVTRVVEKAIAPHEGKGALSSTSFIELLGPAQVVERQGSVVHRPRSNALGAGRPAPHRAPRLPRPGKHATSPVVFRIPEPVNGATMTRPQLLTSRRCHLLIASVLGALALGACGSDDEPTGGSDAGLDGSGTTDPACEGSAEPQGNAACSCEGESVQSLALCRIDHLLGAAHAVPGEERMAMQIDMVPHESNW